MFHVSKNIHALIICQRELERKEEIPHPPKNNPSHPASIEVGFKLPLQHTGILVFPHTA